MLAGCNLRVAAPWCRGPIGPWLVAPVAKRFLGCLIRSAACLGTPSRRCPLAPEQCHICLTPAGLLPRASIAGWGLLT